MAAQRKGSDRLDQKQANRLQKEIEAEPAPSQTGIYDGFSGNRPHGQQHAVTVDGGSVFGEFITPSAVGVGQKVAIYYDNSGNLFDTL